MENNFSTPNKQNDNMSKSNKSHTQCRQGDWICFNCNNLNFSFRKKCNRCKTQTKKQNEDIQTAYSYYYFSQNSSDNYLYGMEGDCNKYSGQFYNYVPDINSEQDINPNFENIDQNLSFSRNTEVKQYQSPFKLLENNIPKYEQNSNTKGQQNLQKKLRTPSSKKKSILKKNDLPSVSPLLKKLLAKQNSVHSKKSGLNVALFYDEIWDTNKQNYKFPSLNFSEEKPSKLTYESHSGKKVFETSALIRTTDSAFSETDSQKLSFKEDDLELLDIIGRIIL